MVEVADVHRVEEPTAQKPHRCHECHTEIPKGQTYKRVTTLFDGAWETMKICPECWTLGIKFEEWEYGLLGESVRQAMYGYPKVPEEFVRFRARYYAALAEGASLKTVPFICGEFGEAAKDLGFAYRRVAYALAEAADLLQDAAQSTEES